MAGGSRVRVKPSRRRRRGAVFDIAREIGLAPGSRKSTKSPAERGGEEGAGAEHLPGRPPGPTAGLGRGCGPRPCCGEPGPSGEKLTGEDRPHLPGGGGTHTPTRDTGGAGGAGVSIVSPPPARPPAGGNAGAVILPFTPSLQPPAFGRGRGRGFHKPSPAPSQPPGSGPGRQEPRTMPAACVGRRGRGGHDAVESPSCLPPGNTTMFKPAPLTNRKR